MLGFQQTKKSSQISNINMEESANLYKVTEQKTICKSQSIPQNTWLPPGIFIQWSWLSWFTARIKENTPGKGAGKRDASRRKQRRVTFNSTKNTLK